MEPQPTIDPLVTVVIIYALASGIIYWISHAPMRRDPWDAETDNLLNDEIAAPLCHRCLEPQYHHGWFCPNCGASVGIFNNWMPYVWLFSVGELLRTGVTTHVRRSFSRIVAYLFMSIVEYAILAPVYWYFFFRNLKAQPRDDTEHENQGNQPVAEN